MNRKGSRSSFWSGLAEVKRGQLENLYMLKFSYHFNSAEVIDHDVNHVLMSEMTLSMQSFQFCFTPLHSG